MDGRTDVPTDRRTFPPLMLLDRLLSTRRSQPKNTGILSELRWGGDGPLSEILMPMAA